MSKNLFPVPLVPELIRVGLNQGNPHRNGAPQAVLPTQKLIGPPAFRRGIDCSWDYDYDYDYDYE